MPLLRQLVTPRPRRAVISLVTVAALALILAAGAGASPSLATLELVDHAPTSRNSAPDPAEVALTTIAEDGRSIHRILAAPFEAGGFLPNPFGGISFSPDGSQLAFVAETEAESGGSRAVYLVNADGSGLRRLPGSQGALDPVVSPDGRTLAFSRLRSHPVKLGPGKFRPGGGYASTTTWLLDLATGKARRLTPWRNGLSIEPGSFSPDGSMLALTRTDHHRHLGPEVILVPVGGGAAHLLVAPAEEPDFSPDGRKVAFVGYQDPIKIEAEENQGYVIGEVYSIGIDGKGLRRLTKNKAIETSPAWDPSGTRIAYVEARPEHGWLAGLENLFSIGNRIREMNPDGSCQKTIRSVSDVGLNAVAWSPVEHLAAPIGC